MYLFEFTKSQQNYIKTYPGNITISRRSPGTGAQQFCLSGTK